MLGLRTKTVKAVYSEARHSAGVSVGPGPYGARLQRVRARKLAKRRTGVGCVWRRGAVEADPMRNVPWPRDAPYLQEKVAEIVAVPRNSVPETLPLPSVPMVPVVPLVLNMNGLPPTLPLRNGVLPPP